MKAIFGKKDCDIQVLDQPVRDLGPDEVLLKILACGVCGTDLHFVRRNAELTPLGHEIAAEILECGPMVPAFRPGQTVTAEDNTICGWCPACKDGHPEKCRNFYQLNGQAGMAEYLVVNYRALTPYEGLKPEHACLTEPTTVSYLLCKEAGIRLGGKVAVMGSGVIGLMCGLMAKRMGASDVALIGGSASSPRGKARLAAAREMGVDHVLASSEHEDVAADVKDLLHGGADCVILTSPPETLPTAMDMCAHGGKICVAGIDLGPKGKVQVDVDAIVFRKLQLAGILSEPSLYFPTSVKLLQEGLIPAELLVSRVFGFEDAKEVITGNANGTLPIIKAVFMP